VLEAARRVTGTASKAVPEEVVEPVKPVSLNKEPAKSAMKSSSKKEKKGMGMSVAFNADKDLDMFNTKSATLIKDKSSKNDENEVLKSLFVTQEEDALEEFEKEKNEEIEGTLGKSVKMPEIKKGWNEWAGDGVDNSKHELRVTKAEGVRRNKIDELKKKRLDNKLQGVQINETEDRDKKFAQKYNVKELPHPYTSAKQYDALMSMPVGKEWNTHDSYKRLIQSDVLTKAGTIIKPLKHKKDLPMQTIEKLVQHR